MNKPASNLSNRGSWYHYVGLYDERIGKTETKVTIY